MIGFKTDPILVVVLNEVLQEMAEAIALLLDSFDRCHLNLERLWFTLL